MWALAVTVYSKYKIVIINKVVVVKSVMKSSSFDGGYNSYGMTIECLKCRAYLNFEVDFGVNDAIGPIVNKCDFVSLG